MIRIIQVRTQLLFMFFLISIISYSQIGKDTLLNNPSTIVTKDSAKQSPLNNQLKKAVPSLISDQIKQPLPHNIETDTTEYKNKVSNKSKKENLFSNQNVTFINNIKEELQKTNKMFLSTIVAQIRQNTNNN
jgi:hypothetical protein